MAGFSEDLYWQYLDRVRPMHFRTLTWRKRLLALKKAHKKTQALKNKDLRITCQEKSFR
jgi:hypothetical protein